MAGRAYPWTTKIHECISYVKAALCKIAKTISKGQLISEYPFDVLNFQKNQRKNLTSLTNLKSGEINKMKLGQKSVKNLVGFKGNLKTPKFYSEINWPLVSIHTVFVKNISISNTYSLKLKHQTLTVSEFFEK